MLTYLTDAAQLVSSFEPPPILVTGDSATALQRGARTIEDHGLRVAAAVPLDLASGRIERQAAMAALWIELDSDGGGELESLLERVRSEVADHRYGAVVAGRATSIDALWPQLADSSIELVIDANEAERSSALASTLAESRLPNRVADVTGDRSAVRLRQLSDEVSRIASALARLSSTPAQPAAVEAQGPSAEVPDISADTVRSVIRARRLRSRFFPEELFADPAWDMLLDLLQAEIAQLRVPVSSLCIAAAVPATTALRWLKTMTQEGLFVRRADPHDGRRIFVELAPRTSQSLRRYFAEVGKTVVV